jgi:hypothetical protein
MKKGDANDQPEMKQGVKPMKADPLSGLAKIARPA